jgi:predicted nucleic acid-binding protein
MILADTSVWIDFLNGSKTVQTPLLLQALEDGELLMGDLILVEILQGFSTARQTRLAEAALSQLDCRTLCGSEVAPVAAANYAKLRRAGITLRGTIDVIIATWCILNGVKLLHADRDFAAMERKLGSEAYRGI